MSDKPFVRHLDQIVSSKVGDVQLAEQVRFLCGMYALLANAATLKRMRGEGMQLGQAGGDAPLTKEAGAQLRIVRSALQAACAISEKSGKDKLFVAQDGECHVDVLDGIVDAVALSAFVCTAAEQEMLVWAKRWEASLDRMEVVCVCVPQGGSTTRSARVGSARVGMTDTLRLTSRRTSPRVGPSRRTHS